MTPVLMFPGQSSCASDMFAEATTRWPELTSGTMRAASEALGRDLEPWLGSVEPSSNQDRQLAVLIANHIHLRALEQHGVVAHASLGLSLGEYNHLIHIGAISFTQALQLVAARGAAYDAGPSGKMAAVFPIALTALRALLIESPATEALEVVNENSPIQHVIAGPPAAIDAALALIEEHTFARAVVIEHHRPMHSTSFRSVANAYRPYLERAHWRKPDRPYLPNVTAVPLISPTAQQFVDLLARHVCEPVRWRSSIEHVARAVEDPVFVEVGPGNVLVNLLRKPWRNEKRVGTEAWDRALEVLRGH